MMGGETPSAPAGRSLAAVASRGAVITLGGQGLRLVAQVAGIVVLARLLGPDDFGLVAIVAVIVGLGELLRDFGLFSAAVQAKTLTTGQRDNLFWLNTGIGVLLGGLLCAAAPLVAAGFDDDRLVLLTIAMSATFVLNGISTQYRAMLVRHLRFGRLSTAELAGQVGGVAVGIAMAVAGAGYWSLVGQSLAQGLVALVLLLITSRWLPGRWQRTASVRSFIGYGMPLLGSQLLNYLSANIDTLTIGARFGAASAGLYNRGFQLVMMPLLQVQAPSTRVALPVLSRLQDDRKRFADFLLGGQLVLLTLIGGGFAVLFAQAPAVIAIALGPQWDEVVPLFRILLLAGFFQAANYSGHWVFLAKGLTRSQLHYALATRPFMAALVVAGSVWGVLGVAAAYLVSMFLTWPMALLWLRRVSDAPVRGMFGNGVRTAVVFGSAGALSWASTAALPAGAAILHVLVGAAAVLASTGLTCVIWPSFRRDLLSIAALRRHLRRGRPAAAPAGMPDRARPTAPAPDLARAASGRRSSTTEGDE
jgi:PST family polysaccharide transporter